MKLHERFPQRNPEKSENRHPFRLESPEKDADFCALFFHRAILQQPLTNEVFLFSGCCRSAALRIARDITDDTWCIIVFLEVEAHTLDGDRKAFAVIGELLVGDDICVVGILTGKQVRVLPLGLDLAENIVVILLVRVVKRIGLIGRGLINRKNLLINSFVGYICPTNRSWRGRGVVGTANQKTQQPDQKA